MIVLANKSQSVADIILGKHSPWVYLGEDYLELQRLTSIHGAETRISYSESLSETFSELRPHFITWSSKLGALHGYSKIWWLTPLAGRNVTCSQFFLQVCYLAVLKRLITERGRESELIVICDNWPLFEGAKELLQSLQVNFTTPPGTLLCRPLSDLGTLVSALTIPLLQALRQIVIILTARLAVAPRSPIQDSRPVSILHTCVDEACFAADESFRDRYYGDLAGWLSERGYRVLIVPWIFNLNRTRISAYRWFERSNQQHGKAAFLLLDRYLSLLDIPAALLTVFRTALVARGEHAIAGLNVTPLVRQERLLCLIKHSGNIYFVLYFAALRRWFSVGNHCELLIDLFENMVPEKPLLRAIKHYAPDCDTFGYQHAGGVPPELISYALTEAEWQSGAFPETIVANSHFSAATLAESGIPRSSLRVGPAFRFRYLNDLPLRAVQPLGEQQILVLLPLELNSALELIGFLRDVRSALEQLKISIKLKLHPMFRSSSLALLGEIPLSWRWVEGEVRDLVESAAMVFGENSVLLDAAASGIPFLAVKRELRLAHNPLAFWQERFPWCRSYSLDQARDRFADLFQELIHDYQSERMVLAREIRESFGRFSDADYAAFLPSGVAKEDTLLSHPPHALNQLP